MGQLCKYADSPFKVLLVEDNPGDAELVKIALSSEPGFIFTLHHAERLSEAIQLHHTHPFDAIILDLGLPDSFGVESLQQMRQTAPDLPIIVLTGSDDVTAGRLALTLGAQDYLIKDDYDPAALTRALIYSHDRHHFAIAERSRLDQKNRQLIQAHENLEKTSHELKKMSQIKSEFIANMSHEIRTPLGAMLGFAQLMSDPNQSVPDRQDCIATIIRNGEQLARVINEILDLSKIESDRMEIENIEFSIFELIENVTSLLNLQALEKGLRFSVVYGEDVPNMITSDPTRLRQILLNVIGNAIKFTALGSVTVSVTTSPRERNQTRWLQITVTDTGRGLNEEQQVRLFHAFVQADSSIAREFGGTGLGLLLSKRLAQALGGDVVIASSSPNVGSVFRVRIQIDESSTQATTPLPAKPQCTPASFAPSVAPPVIKFNLDGLRVLIVDDSPDNRVLISRFLLAAAARVECANDGSEAIEKALHGEYDVVLMDIQMPKVDGFAALKSLRAHNFKPPIIALTAHAMKGDRERCLEAGFNDHIVKPINQKELLGRLAEFLEHRVTRATDLNQGQATSTSAGHEEAQTKATSTVRAMKNLKRRVCSRYLDPSN